MASVGTTPGKWLFGCYVQYSISDAYAKREMRSQIWRSFKRAFRVWWEGMGCGFPLLAPILIAIAFEKLAHNHETDWDFAQDCLAIRRARPGAAARRRVQVAPATAAAAAPVRAGRPRHRQAIPGASGP